MFRYMTKFLLILLVSYIMLSMCFFSINVSAKDEISAPRVMTAKKTKSPLFMEGKELFTPMNLFYTRRIQNPRFGANLTGKIGSYTVGFLTASDEEEKANP